MLHLHLLASLLAAALILVVLAAPKGGAWHRGIGRLAVAVWTVSALSSFALPAWGVLSPIHALTALTLLMLPLGLWHARRGRVRAHRAIMLCTAGGLFVAGGFAALTPGRHLYGVLFG